ncbi:hypothetical protein MFLAVUS_008697 [Mucor flavus]|uniref:C2H2-type domain-containing protein n=1 Tax=Mucor flavus TaxID=439312 RepID=A0ABP9Z7Z1_9FUNG
MYEEKHHFIGHLRKIHPTALAACPDLVTNCNDKNNYCIAFDTTLYSRNSYLLHLPSVHLEEKPELYRGIDCKSPSKRDVRFKKYCVDCHKVFQLRSLYHIHLDKIHGIKPLQYFPTADDPDVKHCSLCDKTLQGKDAYRFHMINAHNIVITGLTIRRPVTNRNETPVVDLLKKYCNVCDRVYKTLESYRGHLFKYHHTTFGRKKLLPSRFNRKEIPIITEIDNFCTACKKPYTDRISFKAHLHSIYGITLPRMNHKALQINCDIIPNFTDEKNRCASCNRTYSNRTSYKGHLAAVHDMTERNIKQEDQNAELNIRSVQTN